MEKQYVWPSDSDELTHWGIKGMKWGIRRFQNKDGSLTPAGKKRYDTPSESEESKAERRTKALNSSDANYIYKNRDVLSTNEINERLVRIDTERRLANVAQSTKKTGYDYVDSALKLGRKAAEVYDFMQKPMMKALIAKATGKKPESLSPDLAKVVKNFDTISDEKLTKILKRASTENTLRKMSEDLEKANQKAKRDKAQFDEWNKPRDLETDTSNEGRYRWSKPKEEAGESFVTTVLSLPSSGSKVDQQALIGQTYIAGLLPAPKDDDD